MPTNLTANQLAAYTGEYTRTDGTPIYVTRADTAGLAVVVTGNVFGLQPEGRDTFMLVGVAERIYFGRSSLGEVTTVSDSRGTYPRRSSEVPPAVRALFDKVDVAPYDYAVPGEREGQPVSRATDQGFTLNTLQAVIDDIHRDPDYANVHSLLISRGGNLVLEEYFMGYNAARSHNLRSATKGIISALVGAAVLRGEVNLSDHPLDYIAREAGVEISTHKQQLTLAAMLDMRHGLQCNDWDVDSPGNESNIYGEPDWTAFVFDIPDADDPADPSYCSAMPLMVGRYLELVTGRSLADYADEVLFTPLGLIRSDWTWEFILAAKDSAQAAHQAFLRPRDMLRVAHLYQNNGVWKGRRLLPEGWVAETFAATMPLGDWRRYKNFWWAYDIERPAGGSVGVRMASGIGGQKIALVPELDLAIVLTGGSFSRGRPGPTKIIERIVSAVGE